MKIKIFSLVIFVFLYSAILAQQKSITNLPYTHNHSGSQAYFTPEKPTYGDKIKVRFKPGEKSEVAGLDSLYMDVLFLFRDGGYVTEEYLMKKNETEWTTKFTLENNAVGCMAIQFASPDFKKVDCNNEQGWDLMVYDKNGLPVKGANMAYANGYMTHGLIRRVQDMDKYRTGMLNELKFFPDDPINLVNTWFFRLGKEGKQKIKNEVDSLLVKHPNDIKILERLYYQYSELKDTVNRDIVYKRILELDPKNSVALWSERGYLFFKPTDRNKIDALYQLIAKAEGTNVYETLQRDYFQNLIKAKYYERAAEFLIEWQKPDWVEAIVSPRMMLEDCYKVNFLPNKLDLNSKLRLSEDNTKLQNIIRIASGMTKYAIVRYQNVNVTDRAKEEIPSEWYSQRKRFIGIAYGNLGYAKFLTNEADSANIYYNISKKILGDDFYKQGDESYYSMLLKMGENSRAFEEAKQALKIGSYNTELLHQVLRIAADTPSRKKEAEEIIGKDKSSVYEERENEINLNFFKEPKAVIDFTLPDLNGNKINLSALKGKIVILEFWDTYCVWCEKSFEKLQSFYNKHKNDKDIFFLTINTNPSSEEKRKTINSYLTEHKYKFPVLFDEDNKIASSYKLSGVPQTLVIGKNGKVYYKESGYGGPTIAEDLEKIVAKISLAK